MLALSRGAWCWARSQYHTPSLLPISRVAFVPPWRVDYTQRFSRRARMHNKPRAQPFRISHPNHMRDPPPRAAPCLFFSNQPIGEQGQRRGELALLGRRAVWHEAAGLTAFSSSQSGEGVEGDGLRMFVARSSGAKCLNHFRASPHADAGM